MRLPVATLLLVLATSAASAETIAGRASVIDGDTIDIHGERIRILDIDAPESRQTCHRDVGWYEHLAWRCGQEAALALSGWIGDRPVTCETTGADRYKRWLARCSVAGEDVAEWLAANGWGFPYRSCKCEVIRAAVDRAKAAGLGIWAGSIAAPWNWRKAN